MQTGISLERQVAKGTTVSLTYLNSRGEHQLFIRNINAPACSNTSGTLTACSPANGGVRPLAGTYGGANVFAYDSSGIFRQNQLIANMRVSIGSRVSLFGFYSLNFADSDLGSASYSPTISSAPGGGFSSGGAGSSPGFLSDPYDPMADYGRATFDVRHRAVLGGSISMPYGFRFNPFMLVTSGRPFNITLGQDVNGDSVFNDRPAFAAPGTGGKVTSFGTFNTGAPLPGQAIVPINYGTGSASFTLNLRVSKSLGFGPKLDRASAVGVSGGPGGPGGPGGGPGGRGGGGLGPRGLAGGGGPRGGPFGAAPATRRYNLTFSASARNVLNHVNYATPVGNVNSQSFGQPIALMGPPFSSGSANRRIDLQMLFVF